VDMGQEFSSAAIDRSAGTSILFLYSKEAQLFKGEGCLHWQHWIMGKKQILVAL
jgi:hypothetical protein